MATIDEIKGEIATLLRIPEVGTGLRLNSDTIGRAYEAYILVLCKKAVIEAGGNATLRGINSGDNPNPIVFRGAPGDMSSTDQNFCYVYCELNGREFEIHLDVQYEGSSGATHEIDVSIYNSASADTVRSTRRLPKTNNNLLMTFECKFYTRSIPSTGLARGFAGLVKDCSSNRLNAFVSNNASKNLKKYFSNKNNLEPFVDLDPVNKSSEDRFIRIIEQALRKWAI